MAKIFLMVLASLSLLSCKKEKIEQFPSETVLRPILKYEKVVDASGEEITVLNVEKSYCVNYQIISKREVKIGNGKKVHLSYCNGIYGLSAKDTAPAMDFIREQLK